MFYFLFLAYPVDLLKKYSHAHTGTVAKNSAPERIQLFLGQQDKVKQSKTDIRTEDKKVPLTGGGSINT